MNSSTKYSSRSLPASVAQFKALVGMMESEPEIARGLKNTLNARIKTQKFWEKVAPILNDLGGGTKPKNKWMKFWTDKKCSVRKKAAERSSTKQKFGEGLEDVRWLTDTEERVLQILGTESYAVEDSQHQDLDNQVEQNSVVCDASPITETPRTCGPDTQVVDDAEPSVTEEDVDGNDSDTPVEENIVDNADPSITEKDDDGDDFDTPVDANMCRVCLALDVKMYDLRDNELKTMFQNITGIMFNVNHGSVLASICWECAARLKAAATFRSKALLSDSLLQYLITSGKKIRKHDITALKEIALSQGLISAKTLTVIDVFHIVDIEDQNNTTQLLQGAGDDGDQTLLSENNDTANCIIEEIKEDNSEMDVEDNVAIKSEIEGDLTSPNTEEEDITKIKEKTPMDITSSSEDTIKSAYCSLLMDMGLIGERNPQENDENETVVRKSIVNGIKEDNSEMEIEDDNNVAIKTEIEDDRTSPNKEERNTEGENPQISSPSHDKINSAYSSLLLDIGQCLLRNDIPRSPQKDSDTEKIITNTISKSDPISRTGPQQITESTNERNKHSTSHDHTYNLKPNTQDINKKKDLSSKRIRKKKWKRRY